MRRDAFTLVEIIACLLLFAMGTMATIGVVIHGMASAARAQADATAWATAMSALQDPLPLGGEVDAAGDLRPWTWTRSGAVNVATDGSGAVAWRHTAWPLSAGDVLVPDMRTPVAGNPTVFPPGGDPIPGCARGWINGFYVERREQSRAGDRIGDGTRIVEARVDVYWAAVAGSGDGQPLASAVHRFVRQEGP